MSGLSMEIVVKDQAVQDLLNELSGRMSDLTAPMQIIGELVVASIQRNFDEGGRPVRWPDLAESTKERRRRIGKWPGQILVVSGRLRSVYPTPGPDSVSVASNLKAAVTQNFGAKKGAFGQVESWIRAHVRRIATGKTVSVKEHKRKALVPWGDIPAREFFMVQDEDWPEIGNVLLGFMTAS